MKDKEMRKEVNDDSISALENLPNNSDISHTMKVAIDGVSQYHTSLMVLTLTQPHKVEVDSLMTM